MNRYTVKLDFDDGGGWRDVSHLVAPSIAVERRVASESFKHAISSAKFRLYYDSSIVNHLLASTNPVRVRIERDGAALFTGHIPPMTRATSLGRCDGVSPVEIDAEDDTNMLDVDLTDDIVIKEAYLCDVFHSESSVVHRLLAQSGRDFAVATYSVPEIMPCFVAKEGDNLLDVMNQVLREYGYTFAFDEFGRIALFSWRQLPAIAPSGTFGATRRKALTVEAVEVQYGGTKVKWTPAKTKQGVLLYQADLPFASDGTRLGYPVQPNHYYPEEAELREVWFEYSDDALDYHVETSGDTQVAVKENDASGILVTENHVLDMKTDSGLLLHTAIFGNYKARVALRNPSSESKNVYYLNIKADVMYRGAWRESVAGSGKLYEYTASHIFTTEHAENLAGAMTLCNGAGRYRYQFESEESIPLWGVIEVQDEEMAVAGNAVVVGASYSSETPFVEYRLVSVAPLTMTARTRVRENASRKAAYTMEYRFKRSASKPERPTAPDTEGWAAYIPPGADTLWMTSARRDPSTGVAVGEWSDPIQFSGQDGKSPYTLVIESSTGTIYRPGQIYATLTARVFDAYGEVTEQLQPIMFVWERQSANSAADAVWNSNHAGVGNVVLLTPADFIGVTKFICTLIQ